MDSSTITTSNDDQATPTSPKRPPTGLFTGPPKRPTIRSNSKLATDFLLDENRIGMEVHKPHKKRRYITLYLSKMMPALVTLYSFLFKVHWTHFRHVESKYPQIDKASNIYESFAIIYLSHWLYDLYRINRKSLESLDPVAFAEKYYTQVSVHSDRYDNFLALLASHIRPTHIQNNYADDVYIPILTKKATTTTLGALNIDWDKLSTNFELFSFIIFTLENKKLVKMTPLSSDLLGRPSWLFDWTQTQSAFSWFPQEGNYNEEDIAVAYVIGDACTPKLGHADIDDWKYTNAATLDLSTLSLITAYKRVTPRRWSACAEFRTAEVEEVHLPNYYEKDEATFAASNTGPIQLVSDCLAKLTVASSSTTEDETSGQVDASTVPASPRYSLRSRSGTTQAKYHRTRVIDRLYYHQVIKYFDTTSQFTAFKLFTKYE